MIVIEAKKLTTLRSKLLGLIGRDRPESIFFRTRFGIHTFGVRFPIDVVILNTQNRIVALKECLQSNNIFFWNPLHNKVLELPMGTIKQKKLSMHAKISLRINNSAH